MNRKLLFAALVLLLGGFYAYSRSHPYRETIALFNKHRRSFEAVVDVVRQDKKVGDKIRDVPVDTEKLRDLLFWSTVEAVRPASGDVSVWFHLETTGMLSTRIVGVAYLPDHPADIPEVEKYVPYDGNWYIFDFYFRQ